MTSIPKGIEAAVPIRAIDKPVTFDRAASAPKMGGGPFRYCRFHVPDKQTVRIVVQFGDGTEQVLLEDVAAPVVLADRVHAYEVRVLVRENLPAELSKAGYEEPAEVDPPLGVRS
jgi:hypothetical protein